MRNCVLYFQGRVKNLIVLANGENVSPEELETRLYQLEGVRDAIVYEITSRSQPRSMPTPPCSRMRRRCGEPSARSTGICRLHLFEILGGAATFWAHQQEQERTSGYEQELVTIRPDAGRSDRRG